MLLLGFGWDDDDDEELSPSPSEEDKGVEVEGLCIDKGMMSPALRSFGVLGRFFLRG